MAKDPYRYFRIEAQELLDGLSQGLIALEKSEVPNVPLLRTLLRQTHTFKGASRVVRQTDIGDIAHELEGLLSPHRDTGGPVAREVIDDALAEVDRIRTLVAALDEAPPDDAPSSEGEGERESTSDGHGAVGGAEVGRDGIRVAVRDVDSVLAAALETHMASGAIRRGLEGIGRARLAARALLDDIHNARFANPAPGDERRPSAFSSRLVLRVEAIVDELETVQRGLTDRVEQLARELDELRVAASELRLVPAEVMVTELERVVRDAGRALDKEVELSVSGAQTHIDAPVMSALRKALVHVVRNGVAHGIEDRRERALSGKPAIGRLTLHIERRGHRVAVACRDDGRGLDLAAVSNMAVERGLVSREAARALDEDAVGRLLLRGGLSTRGKVDAIAGRGLGLEAVRHAVESVDGEVLLTSTSGRGTTVEIVVPLSLSAVPALSMLVDDSVVLVPLESVRQAVRVRRTDIARDADGGERVVVDGEVLPYMPLASLLNHPVREVSAMQNAVVVEAAGARAAIGVDGLGAARSVVVRSIPAHASASPLVSGAALDDEGTPQLMVAPPALVLAASRGRPTSVSIERELPPLLVVDDSLTTRMLEQSILESAGYVVDLATSAEEGLSKARQRRYGVFIVDVEMPGMNGFEFVAVTQTDPDLRDTPTILVTSRGDADDKQRGKDVGARGYIVKSEFDQAELLDRIRRLTR